MATRRPTLTAPIVGDLRLTDLTDRDADDLQAHGHHEATRFTDADLSGRDLSGITFTECELTGVDLDGTQLRGGRLVETRIARATAPTLRAARTTWRDVHVDASRFGAVETFDSEWKSVRVTGSKLSFVNLRSSTLRDVAFEHCVIDQLDLGQARAERVSFAGCTVGALLIDQATLSHVDLRGLDLTRISGVEFLRGAALSPTQVMELSHLFAEHLGIVVVD